MPETAASRNKPGWASPTVFLRVLLLLLFLMLLVLQYRLWVGEGSVAELSSLDTKLEAQQARNQQLSERNAKLSAEVDALKNGMDEIEARAREDLGMIKPGETFFMIVDDPGEQGEGQ